MISDARLSRDAIWPEEIEKARNEIKPGMVVTVQDAPFPKRNEEEFKKEILVLSVGRNILTGIGEGDMFKSCWQWADVVRADRARFRVKDHSKDI